MKHELDALFHPASVAVVGASDDKASFGYHYLRHLIDYGFRGPVYPVNPRSETIQGLKAYPSLSKTPGPVDFVICSIPSGKLLDLLDDCRQKGVKFIHLFTAGFSETGRAQSAALEREVLQKARALGIRLVGPNCMGLYVPGQGMSFDYGLPHEAGLVSAIYQSGGGASEFVRHSSVRGLRCSKVVTYGNALDLNECDFLEYLAEDTETMVAAAYIEGIKDGRRFFKALRKLASVKPVVVLKGGRGKAASRATSSHTASLAGSSTVWQAAVRQAGAVPVRSLEEIVDAVLALYYLPPLRSLRVGVAGGGGGRSVLAADACEDAGLDVVPLPESMRLQLKEQAPQIWDWLGNPVDCSILNWSPIRFPDILRMMATNDGFDLALANLSTEAPFYDSEWKANVQREVDAVIEVSKKRSKPMVAVMTTPEPDQTDPEKWRWDFCAEERLRLIAAGVPVFPTVARAAWAVKQVAEYWGRR